MAIKLLKPQIINQIAAGEVIERPSSVLKELLENSFDAFADQITIEVENGGTTFLKIQDNGHGIEKEDLPLALVQHATSKIKEFTDLNTLTSLGFRGEALASIASVSKLKLISRTSEAKIAYQINCEGNPNEYSIAPDTHPIGTTIEVRDLFFNVPVRQKFLKKPSTEYNYLNDWLGKLILSRNEINFTFRHNKKNIWQFSPAFDEKTQLYRANKILAENFAEKALPVKAEIDGYRLYGWISEPSLHKNQSDFQYLYLNRRWIKDKNLLHAIRSAYQDLLPNHTYPVTLLFLEVNPQFFDVNVHPTKNEVRFNDPQLIYGLILNSLKQSLMYRKTNPITLQQPTQIDSLTQTKSSVKKSTGNNEAKNISDQFKEESKTYFSTIKPSHNFDKINSVSKINQIRNKLQIIDPPINNYNQLNNSSNTNNVKNQELPVKQNLSNHIDLGQAITQLHNTYLLSKNNQGLIIIDIHAACERITYENLKIEMTKYKKLPSQRLISPLTIKIKNIETLETFDLLLRQLGFEWRDSGENTIILLSIPAILKNETETIFTDVIKELETFSSTDEVVNKINHFLATLACHNSIRSGQVITLQEGDQLLRKIEQLPNSDRCNHGRPTWIQLTQKDLNKLFLRT